MINKILPKNPVQQYIVAGLFILAAAFSLNSAVSNFALGDENNIASLANSIQTENWNWSSVNAPSGTHSYREMAVSGSGQKIALASSYDGSNNGDYISISNNSGQSWNQGSIQRKWSGISMSEDGKVLAAISDRVTLDRETNQYQYFPVYVSTDGGDTWSASASGEKQWASVKVSADGKTIIATDLTDIYITNNNGTNWTKIGGLTLGYVGSNSISGDGKKIAVFSGTSGNYSVKVLKNAGSGWSLFSTTPITNSEIGVVISRDGSKIYYSDYAAAVKGYIYRSTDDGLNWSAISDSLEWHKQLLSVSNTGSSIASAGVNSSSLQTSGNQGISWKIHTTNPGSKNWLDLAYNSAGTKLYALDNSGKIYIGEREIVSGSISIVSPANGQNVEAVFSPIIDWGDATTCEYKYEYTNFGDDSILCSNFGADIDAPTSGPDEHTLTIKATNGVWNKTESVKFTYNPVSYNWPINPIGYPTQGNENITSVAVSADLSQVYVPVNFSGVFKLKGSSWEKLNVLSKNWRALDSSSDGLTLYGATGLSGDPDYIYKSTDGGKTWSISNPQRKDWIKVKTSGDGKYALGFERGSNFRGELHFSDNYGTSWSTISSLGSKQWFHLTISETGEKMAVYGEGNIFVSTDYGRNWTARNPSAEWPLTISYSGDGKKLYALSTSAGTMYVSSNDGINWSKLDNAPSQKWVSVSTSYTGEYIVASHANESAIYVSTDFGQSWKVQSPVSNQRVVDVKVSKDGQKILVAQESAFGSLWIGSIGDIRTPADITPPSINSQTPTSFDANTTIVISVSTDENSNCKYSSQNTTYASMNSMSSTGAKNHSHSLTPAPAGNYTYYVKCADNATPANISPDGFPVSFTVRAPVSVAPSSTLVSSSFSRLLQSSRSNYLNHQFKIVANISAGSEAITLDPRTVVHSLTDGNGNKVTKSSQYNYSILGSSANVTTIPANTTATVTFNLDYRIDSTPKSTGAVVESVKYKVGNQTKTLTLNHKATPVIVGTLPKPNFNPLPAETNLLTHDLLISGNGEVTGYFVREGSSQYPLPLATDAGWVTTPPTTHTFSQEGYRTIYVWTKDQHGNISKYEGYGLNIDTTRNMQEEEVSESEPEARGESWVANILKAISGWLLGN